MFILSTVIGAVLGTMVMMMDQETDTLNLKNASLGAVGGAVCGVIVAFMVTDAGGLQLEAMTTLFVLFLIFTHFLSHEKV